jgi:hypothetical protein
MVLLPKKLDLGLVDGMASGDDSLSWSGCEVYYLDDEQRISAERYFSSNPLASILSLLPAVVAGYCDFRASPSESGQKNVCKVG